MDEKELAKDEINFIEELKERLKSVQQEPNIVETTQDLEGEEKRLLNLRKDEYYKEQIQRLKDDNEARKNFSQRIFTLTVMWLFFILLIVLGCAMNIIHLSDSVLIALITTSTINVLGFFTAVTLYLFNKDKST